MEDVEWQNSKGKGVRMTINDCEWQETSDKTISVKEQYVFPLCLRMKSTELFLIPARRPTRTEMLLTQALKKLHDNQHYNKTSE